MIFRHFTDERSARHSYLFAMPDSREAAIVNPQNGQIEKYLATLKDLDLRLVYTLETDCDRRTSSAACALHERSGSGRVAPVPLAHDRQGAIVDIEAKPGHGFALGNLYIKILESSGHNEGQVAYRVTLYTFSGDSVLIDYNEATLLSNGEPETLLDQLPPTPAPSAASSRTEPIRNYRTQREGVCVERVILEDLHTSLAEGRFTPKEGRVVLSYIRFMEENDWRPPTALQLSAVLDNVDRTAIHVLIHNVRWKQIDLQRLPVVLTGQTSKWLRGLQTKPEFTSHEREFLSAYLRLVAQQDQPPSGPDIANELDGRTVQWVRKRAHTIRAKQRAYKMNELVLSRKATEPSQRSHYDRKGRRPTRLHLVMHYGA